MEPFILLSVGIDFSICSPGLTIHRGSEWSFSSVKMFFNGNLAKDPSHAQIAPYKPSEVYETQIERYDNMSQGILEVLLPILDEVREADEPYKICIEGYSMGSVKGNFLNIAENCAVLKFKLWSEGLEWEEVAPTQVKKFGSGKGNAKKEQMIQAFMEETSLNLPDLFKKKKECWGSPTSDIVDSFYLCKMAHQKLIA